MELQAFLERLQRVTRSSDGWSARCPAHDDRDPSLSVGLKDNKILVKCHANPECPVERIVAALGLTKADLFTDNAEPRLELQSTYHYVDEFGVELFQKLRYRKPDGGKTFRIRHQENGAWVWNARGCRRVLYRLPELLGAINEGRTVFVVDGEKDADNLWKAGVPATCDSMGSGKWRSEYGDLLARAPKVVIVADREEGGMEQAKVVAFSLGERTEHEIVEAATGKDVSDHLRAGRTVEELVPVGGLEDLLARIEQFIRRFVVLDDAQACACTLWVAHCWAVDAAYSTPYLHVTSAEEESGKTRLLEVLELLVPEPILAADITEAALYRVIDSKQPTLFLDEVDAVFSKKKEAEGTRDVLRSLLNAGYRRGLKVYRAQQNGGKGLDEFEVFCPKALAGLGSLPRTLASRCIRIEMQRRSQSEPVADFMRQDLEPEAEELKTDLLTWRERSVETLRSQRPLRVHGLRDRANEVWRALLSLTPQGWDERARKAALELAKAGTEPSYGVQLLEDMRKIFDEHDLTRIATVDMLDWLYELDESPWKEWWQDTKGGPRGLAKLLKPYKISSQNIKTPDDSVAKGYKRENFEDVWSRLLLPPEKSATSAKPLLPLEQAKNGKPESYDVADDPLPKGGGWD